MRVILALRSAGITLLHFRVVCSRIASRRFCPAVHLTTSPLGEEMHPKPLAAKMLMCRSAGSHDVLGLPTLCTLVIFFAVPSACAPEGVEGRCGQAP